MHWLDLVIFFVIVVPNLILGVSVMQITTNQPSKREIIVSFTEIGIAFRTEASPTVLNILPVVGNKSLAG